MKRRLLILIALCLYSLIPGCKLFEDIGPAVSPDELQSAPEKITFGGRAYILETYLSRDFIPVSPPDGRPLVACAMVTAVDSLKFPSNVTADYVWVVNGLRIWESNFSGEDYQPAAYQLRKVAFNGPKWGPDIYVDVVVRVVDSNNLKHLLKASHQAIHRTI